MGTFNNDMRTEFLEGIIKKVKPGRSVRRMLWARTVTALDELLSKDWELTRHLSTLANGATVGMTTVTGTPSSLP